LHRVASFKCNSEENERNRYYTHCESPNVEMRRIT